jgi:hypothetical protein
VDVRRIVLNGELEQGHKVHLPRLPFELKMSTNVARSRRARDGEYTAAPDRLARTSTAPPFAASSLSAIQMPAPSANEWTTSLNSIREGLVREYCPMHSSGGE